MLYSVTTLFLLVSIVEELEVVLKPLTVTVTTSSSVVELEAMDGAAVKVVVAIEVTMAEVVVVAVVMTEAVMIAVVVTEAVVVAVVVVGVVVVAVVVVGVVVKAVTVIELVMREIGVEMVADCVLDEEEDVEEELVSVL